ncbi:hypothetical protein DB29_03303 [Shouchella clausii]|nr:hypothetical protein DB29_03303 [Shouchella clausii]
MYALPFLKKGKVMLIYILCLKQELVQKTKLDKRVVYLFKR